MKTLFLIVLLAVLLPSVLAADLRVDDIRGFVGNERASDVDEDGGDFDVHRGDIIDLVVSLENNGNETIQAKLKGTIENINRGDDITKEQDFYDIAKDDTRSKTLSFSIPSDARNDIYDMDLKIFFRRSNGTEGTVDEVQYNVVVSVSQGQDEITSKDIDGIILNLTSSCNSIAATTNTCFGYIEKSNTCSNELSTVKEERGAFQQKSNDCESSLGSVRSEKAEVEQQKASIESQMNSMITQMQCSNQTAFAISSVRNENDSKFNQTLLMIGGAAVAYWYYNDRKKRKASVLSSYQSDYYEKA